MKRNRFKKIRISDSFLETLVNDGTVTSYQKLSKDRKISKKIILIIAITIPLIITTICLFL